MLYDKNNKLITSNGEIRFPQFGLKTKVHDGDDGRLYIFIGSMLFPLSMWDTTKLEFIENKSTNT